MKLLSLDQRGRFVSLMNEFMKGNEIRGVEDLIEQFNSRNQGDLFADFTASTANGLVVFVRDTKSERNQDSINILSERQIQTADLLAESIGKAITFSYMTAHDPHWRGPRSLTYQFTPVVQ